MPTALLSERVLDRRNQLARDALVQRIRAEFYEMPGLSLTSGQAQRLFGLRSDVCVRVLGALVTQRTLTRDVEGRYRLTKGRA